MEENFEAVAASSSSTQAVAPAAPQEGVPPQAQPEAGTPAATAEKAPTAPDPAIAERQQRFSQQQEKYRTLRQENSEFFVYQELVKAGAFTALEKDGKTHPEFQLDPTYVAQLKKYFKDSPPEVVQQHLDKVRFLVRFRAEHNISADQLAQLDEKLMDLPLDALIAECKKQVQAPTLEDVGLAPNNTTPEQPTTAPKAAEGAPADPEAAYKGIIENGVGKAALTAYFEKRGIKNLPEDPAERQAAITEFLAFYKEYSDKLRQDINFQQQEKTFSRSMKRIGTNYVKRSYESSDSMELIRALLIQYDNRHSSHRSYLGDEYEQSSDKRLTTDEFKKEICKWEAGEENTDKNKKNWLFTCALMYHNLENPTSPNPADTLKDWGVTPADLDNENFQMPELTKIKEKMVKLHAKCLEHKPSDINLALKKAVQSDIYKARLTPGINTDNIAFSADLLTAFQMLGENTRYGQDFFS